MKIKQLNLLNFQGQSGEQPLAPLTVITGPNFAGKTRLLNAVRVLLLGYCPDLGKRPSDTFQLASSDAMSVSGKIAQSDVDDGYTVDRRFAMKRGSVTMTGDKEPLVPAMLLDAGEYFRLSGPERIAYILENFTGETGIDDALVKADIRRAVGKATASPETEKQIDALMQQVTELVDARHDEGQSMEALLTGIVMQLKSNLTQANATLKAQSGFMKTVVALRETVAVPQNVEALLAQARLKRDKLIENRTAVLNAGKPDAGVVDRNRRRREAKVELTATADHSADINELLARKGDVQLQLQQIPDVDAATREKLNHSVGVESGTRARLRLVGEQLVALDSKIKKQLGYECPCCGLSGDACKASKRILKGYNQERQKLAATQLQDANELETLLKERKGIEAAMENERQIKQRFDQLVRERTAIQTKLDSLHLQQRQHESVEQRVRDLGELEPEAEQSIDRVRLDIIEGDLTVVNGKIAQLQQQHNQVIAQRAEQLQQEQAKQRNDAVMAEVEVLKLALAKAEELQQRFIRSAFDGLLKTARLFTDGILRSPLEYRDGELGRVEGGIWINHRLFSGTEKLLAYAGLSVALVKDAKIKIVLMDEMGRLSGDMKRKVFDRMAALESNGTIHQCIMVDTDATYYSGSYAQHNDKVLLIQVK